MQDESATARPADSSRSAIRSEALTAAGVGLGGAIGASLRWAVGEPLRFASPLIDTFPWPTFVVNVIGCLLIGIASTSMSDRHRLRPMFVTGVLGGFTTMSAFAVELNDLADASRPGVLVAYIVATLATGVGAVVLGEFVSERGSPGRGSES